MAEETKIIDITNGVRNRQCAEADFAYFAARGFRKVGDVVHVVADAAADVCEAAGDALVQKRRGRPRKVEAAE